MADRIERERVQGLAVEEAPVLLSEHMAFELAVRFAVELFAAELLAIKLMELAGCLVNLVDY